MENKLHVVTVIIKKLFKNKDKEHLEESRCSFCMLEYYSGAVVYCRFFQKAMSRILVVELGKAETTSTSTNIHTTRSESFAVFVSSDSFQNAFPRILNVKFTLIVVIILTIRL